MKALTTDWTTGGNTGLGATAFGKRVTFAAAAPSGTEVSLLLYQKGTEEILTQFPLKRQAWNGDVRTITIEGIDPKTVEYNYCIDGQIVTDPAARIVTGREIFGADRERTEHQIRGGLIAERFRWGNDEPPRLAFGDVIAYYLHVRGFTMAPSSGVRHPGTFAGIREKIPYLKRLGVNQLILMPAYEFEEMAALPKTARRAEDPAGGSKPERKTGRVNYWGYAKAWYYAPKTGYCSGSPAQEVKELVKALHRSKMELILEFAFPGQMDPVTAEDILAYWVREYHIDGFRLLAEQSLCDVLSASPRLSGVKLLGNYFDTERQRYGKTSWLTGADGKKGVHLADYHDGFRTDARKLLKGDENMLPAFIGRMSAFSDQKGIYNSITGHDGFTLMDLVSYDQKHNEENGENGRDGAPSEFSWNCGEEGPTKRKQIRDLRLRQMKNAFSMLLLGQGTPVLLAGDEHGNSQRGNNNPYCIDSEVTWLDWRKDGFAKELTAYVRQLTALRKAHVLLRGIDASRAATGGPGGFPAFSAHGSRAWYPSGEYQDRHIGLMYCGKEDGEDAYFYLAFNFHWEEREFALPYLPEGKCWRYCMGTAPAKEKTCCRSLRLPGRTVMVLMAQSAGEEKDTLQRAT